MRPLLLVLVLLTLATPALADVVHLRNGRQLEGKILKQTREAVQLEVREGGTMVLPLSVVERIEESAQVQDELGARYARLDMTDPEAIEALSLWASSKGLTKESRDLHQLSLGVRLDQLVDRAQRGDSVRSWLSVFDWSLRNDMSETVLNFLLEKAAGLRSRAGEVQRAREALQRELAQRQRRETRPPPRPRHYPAHEEDPQRVAKLRVARQVQHQTRRGQPPEGRVSITPSR